jgi:hypothetical protein
VDSQFRIDFKLGSVTPYAHNTHHPDLARVVPASVLTTVRTSVCRTESHRPTTDSQDPRSSELGLVVQPFLLVSRRSFKSITNLVSSTGSCSPAICLPSLSVVISSSSVIAQEF